MKKELVLLDESQLSLVNGGFIENSSSRSFRKKGTYRILTTKDAVAVAAHLGRDYFKLIESMHIDSLEIQKFIDACLILKYTLEEAMELLRIIGIGVRF